VGTKNFGVAKVYDFRRITLLCLEKRLSKHKMTICSKNGGHGPFDPLDTPMSLLFQKTQPKKLSSIHINTNSTYNNLTLAQWFLTFLPTRAPELSLNFPVPLV